MPEEIPLPPFTDQAIGKIGTPIAPSNLPSVADMANAMHYTQTLLNSNFLKEVLNEDVVHSKKYKNRLLFTTDGDAEPPWFSGAIECTLAPIRADIQGIKDGIQGIKRVQGHVWRMAARGHNLSTGYGDAAKLEVVPFPNGQDLTKEPVSTHATNQYWCMMVLRHADSYSVTITLLLPDPTIIHTSTNNSKLIPSSSPLSTSYLINKNKNWVNDYNFKSKELVLVLNKKIKPKVGYKCKPQYFGPMMVVK
ncbi:hypothetical protein BYT27DRAFT_7218000 [Phlegmacium glaucopus]|nr:hypothetical protein BYT27DRAFT_7218000 [Phlegmacium glaucopus]